VAIFCRSLAVGYTSLVDSSELLVTARFSVSRRRKAPGRWRPKRLGGGIQVELSLESGALWRHTNRCPTVAVKTAAADMEKMRLPDYANQARIAVQHLDSFRFLACI
jgi:hypothetical protein